MADTDDAEADGRPRRRRPGDRRPSPSPERGMPPETAEERRRRLARNRARRHKASAAAFAALNSVAQTLAGWTSPARPVAVPASVSGRRVGSVDQLQKVVVDGVVVRCASLTGCPHSWTIAWSNTVYVLGRDTRRRTVLIRSVGNGRCAERHRGVHGHSQGAPADPGGRRSNGLHPVRVRQQRPVVSVGVGVRRCRTLGSHLLTFVLLVCGLGSCTRSMRRSAAWKAMTPASRTCRRG